MVSDTVRFGAPLVGLIIGLFVVVVGAFQSGLNPITYAGIAIGFVSILALSWAGYQVSVETPADEAH